MATRVKKDLLSKTKSETKTPTSMRECIKESGVTLHPDDWGRLKCEDKIKFLENLVQFWQRKKPNETATVSGNER